MNSVAKHGATNRVVRFSAEIKLSASAQKKLDDFSSGLNSLVETDRKSPHPVFKTFKLDQVVNQVRSFLNRQTEAGLHPTSFFVDLSGGSCSGKSTLMQTLKEGFRNQAQQLFNWKQEAHGPVVEVLEVDNYYKNFQEMRKVMGDERFFQETNLDTPAAMTLDETYKDLMKGKNGIAFRAPVYDFKNSSRKDGGSLKVPAPFLIYEGLFTLTQEALRNLADLKIFVDADKKTRSDRFWARAPQRNVKQDAAGWGLHDRMMSMHDLHVQPGLEHADVVVDGTAPMESIQQAFSPLLSLFVKTLYPEARLAAMEKIPESFKKTNLGIGERLSKWAKSLRDRWCA